MTDASLAVFAAAVERTASTAVLGFAASAFAASFAVVSASAVLGASHVCVAVVTASFADMYVLGDCVHWKKTELAAAVVAEAGAELIELIGLVAMAE